MNEDVTKTIAELKILARRDAGRHIENHVAWRAAIILQAVFDPERQPSQYGTWLVEPSKKP